MGCVFVDGFGVGKDGLTPVVRCYRLSDAKFLKNDDTWTAAPSTEYTMTEEDATNMPGVYTFSFAVPDTEEKYVFRMDGTAGAENRYQWFEIESVTDWLQQQVDGVTVQSIYEIVMAVLMGVTEVTSGSVVSFKKRDEATTKCHIS